MGEDGFFFALFGFLAGGGGVTLLDLVPGHDLCLALHIRVGDFRDGGEVKDHGEEEDKDRNAEVYPLDGLKVVLTHILEEDLGGEDGAHDGADGLHGLREVEPHLGVLWGTAHREVWVCSGLEGPETGSDDEGGSAESPEGSLHCCWPEEEGADAVDAETGHEGCFVAPFAEDVRGEGECCDGVGTVVVGNVS